jgi:hypothetical protein
MGFKVLFASLLFLGAVGHADLNDSIDTQKEDGLEADETAMDIHDLEGEQKIAREQARAQDQMKGATEKRLKKLQTQKANISEKIKLDIMLSEAKRKQALATTVANQKQIKSLQDSIKSLQDSRDKALKAAEDAKNIAAAGREQIQELKLKRAQAEEQNVQANAEKKKRQAEVLKLRAESNRLRSGAAN